MLAAFSKLLAERGYIADQAQADAAARLQKLHAELIDFKVARGHKILRIFRSPVPPRGVYFWGGVGRGKSLLMDCFFEVLPYRRKKRLHFHAFMQRIHRDLEHFHGENDPMSRVAEQIATEVRVLCFDEFHVSDIADAMMLGRLLKELFQRGVVLVMTSNYPPEQLYPNGLQRDRFLPAIALLKRNLDVIEVEAGVDYRQRFIAEAEVFHAPDDTVAAAAMQQSFLRLAGDSAVEGGHIAILERDIALERSGEGVIWFSFKNLCGGPRSQNDYLEIARRYPTVMVSGIPCLNAQQSSEARRLTWLIDVLYDHRVKLIASAACSPEGVYTEGPQASEFLRTVSRLTEMRSREYLARQYLES